MIIIALIISLISIIISIYTAIKYKKKINNYENIFDKYSNRLKNTQIQIISLYNFIRQKRNYAFVRRVEFEDAEIKSITQKKRIANHVCAFALQQEEKVLREIEDFMQKENII